MTTIDDELLAVDCALITALAKRDVAAATALLDDHFTWVDSQGRVLSKQQVTRDLPQSPLGAETGLIPMIHRYREVAPIVVERENIFVLRIWAWRGQSWRLLTCHEVSQLVPATPHGPGRKDWDNPCRTLPYQPREDDERDCLTAWQRLETAVMTHDSEEWARHVADEFLVVGATRRHTKPDRKAVIEEQKRSNANSAPAPLMSMQLFTFPEAMVMICEHQPFHGKAARVSRVFSKRDGEWLMAISFQTTRQDAPVKTI